MTIRFQCPQCRKRLIAEDRKAGRRLACPACSTALTIPQPAASADADVEAVDVDPGIVELCEESGLDGRSVADPYGAAIEQVDAPLPPVSREASVSATSLRRSADRIGTGPSAGHSQDVAGRAPGGVICRGCGRNLGPAGRYCVACGHQNFDADHASFATQQMALERVRGIGGRIRALWFLRFFFRMLR